MITRLQLTSIGRVVEKAVSNVQPAPSESQTNHEARVEAGAKAGDELFAAAEVPGDGT